MSLPASFTYMVNRLDGGMVRNTVKITSNSSNLVKQNSSVEFQLPSDSILDLTSLTLRGKFIYQNAVGGTNGVRATIPPHLYFKNVQWALNNNVVCGNNTGGEWGRLYEILRRCGGSQDHENSNCDEYRRMPFANGGTLVGSEAATNSTGQLFAFSGWGGLADCPNSENMDSAILGNIKLRLDLAGEEIVYGYADSGTNDNAWQLEDLEMTVDVITFMGADNIYDMIMGELLGAGEELYIPFQERYATLTSSNANIKFNLSSSSLDLIGWAPVASEGASATQMTSTTGDVDASLCEYGPRFVQFKLQNSSNALPDENSTSETYFFNINQRIYPQYGANPVSRGVQHTKDAFGSSNDLNARNLLFCGNYLDDGSDTLTDAITFNRRNNLGYNCIVAHKLCLTEPAHQSKILSGINTQGQSSTVSLSTNGLSSSGSGDFILMFALTSAVLAVGPGQSVSVVY